MRFRIDSLVHLPNRGTVVIARQLEPGDFTLSDASTIGGVPILPRLSQPRAIKPDGSPDLAVFAFLLDSTTDASRLAEGQLVELA